MSHESPVGESREWYTPPHLFDALDMLFDLDPASPGESIVPWVPAIAHFTRSQDGLKQPWEGRVWLNPPYGPVGKRFVDRMIVHANGIMLLPVRTETRIFQRAMASADDFCFLRDRLHFIRADGFQGRAGFASALFAWGEASSAALAHANLGWMTPAARMSSTETQAA